MSNRRGMTILELFLVLLIFAVIGVILAPIFMHGGGGHHHRYASCLSNPKQLGLSFAMYFTDYDNKFPEYDTHSKPGYIVDFFGEATAAGKRVKLIDDTHPVDTQHAAGIQYLKNLQILQCPSDPCKIRNLSYTWNELFAGCDHTKILAPDRKVVLICEGSITDFTFVRDQISSGAEYDGAWSAMTEPDNYVHNSGLNLLYLDGHAKWLNKLSWPPGGPITPGNMQSACLPLGRP